MHLLYGSRGLNKVALGNFDFFQYSSEGEPHSLYILCSCSTYMNIQNKDKNSVKHGLHSSHIPQYILKHDGDTIYSEIKGRNL